MIYVTGDTHGPIDMNKLGTSWFPDQKNMTKDDYVIICGDFGLVWQDNGSERYWRQWLENKPWTTLWCDGNHENFERLFEIPVIDKFDGKVRQISPSIYYLNRGEVFDIQDHKFFVFGGASSHDKEYRTEHISWWREEMPNREEMQHGINTLNKVNWKVDFVISHCAPSSIQHQIQPWYDIDSLTQYFEKNIMPDVTFKQWFFGHYHVDQIINDKFHALYKNIIRII